MKRKIFSVVISLFLMAGMFAGCTNENVDAHINDPVAYSGTLEDYASFDEATLQQGYLNKHIEVTGTVTGTGYTLFYIGKYEADSVYFACSFAEHTPALEKIEKGQEITLHGVCTSVLDNLITLEGCKLSIEEEETEPSTDPAASEQTDPSAAEEGSDEMVWIPTNGGDKYHTSADCSDMIDPENVTITVAQERGFTPCSFCYG